MNAMIRHASSELHPLEIVFFCGLFGFVAMIPWLARQGLGALHTRRPGLIGLRTLLGFVSMATWFSALAVVPLGNAVALGFTAPLFAALAAVVVLREVIRVRRITAHMAFTRAFSLADTMYLMPFDYLRLPQVAFLGWMLFGEPTDVYTWIGGAIIAASSLYVAHREVKVRAGR